MWFYKDTIEYDQLKNLEETIRLSTCMSRVREEQHFRSLGRKLIVSQWWHNILKKCHDHRSNVGVVKDQWAFQNISNRLNWVSTIAYVKIIPLVSYDILIGMDWLEQHHAFLEYHNNTFICLYEEEKHILVKGIQRPLSIREISALHMKRCLKKVSIICNSCRITKQE
jgi:hypothetical protein